MVRPSSSVYGPSVGTVAEHRGVDVGALARLALPSAFAAARRRRPSRRRPRRAPCVHRRRSRAARRLAVLERHLDQHQHVRVLAEALRDFAVRGHALRLDVGQALRDQRRLLAALLKYSRWPQVSPPMRVARVVDDRHARALARDEDRQHGGVLLRRLVVEDHRPERRLALLRDRQERVLRADERVRVALREQRAALDLALVGRRHVLLGVRRAARAA